MPTAIAVMHEGRILEEGPALDVVRAPQAEHTRDLLAAIPRIAPETARVP